MDIILPNIGETVDEGKVIKWLKQVGDQVADGDVVCEVETDKSTMDVPTTIAGTIKEIKVKEELGNDELIINKIIQFPKILQRPIIINNGKAVIGRPPEKILEISSPSCQIHKRGALLHSISEP